MSLMKHILYFYIVALCAPQNAFLMESHSLEKNDIDCLRKQVALVICENQVITAKLNSIDDTQKAVSSARIAKIEKEIKSLACKALNNANTIASLQHSFSLLPISTSYLQNSQQQSIQISASDLTKEMENALYKSKNNLEHDLRDFVNNKIKSLMDSELKKFCLDNNEAFYNKKIKPIEIELASQQSTLRNISHDSSSKFKKEHKTKFKIGSLSQDIKLINSKVKQIEKKLKQKKKIERRKTN